MTKYCQAIILAALLICATGCTDEKKEAMLKHLRERKAQVSSLESEVRQSKIEADAMTQLVNSKKSNITQMETNASIGLYVEPYTYKLAVDDYNEWVDKYNTKREQHLILFARYETAAKEYNAQVDSFNSMYPNTKI